MSESPENGGEREPENDETGDEVVESDLSPGKRLKKDIDDINYQGATEALTTTRKEAQRTLDNQLSAIDDIDTKAMAILRINIVLLGLVLTAISITTEVAPEGDGIVIVTALNNVYIGAGIISLLLSTALAALTYTASDTDAGISDDKIYAVIDANLTEQQLEVAATQTYAHWIQHNRKINKKNTPLITLTSLLVVVSLTHLALGFYHAFISEEWVDTWIITVVAWGLICLLAYLAGLASQLRDAWEAR